MAGKRKKKWMPSRRRGRVQVQPGAAPGAPTYRPDAPRPPIRVVGYGPEICEERDIERLEELPELLGRWPMLWVNVDGVGHAETMQTLGRTFGLHPLALEDAVNVGQRAKVDPYDEHLFLVVRMASTTGESPTEQIGLFVGDGYVLTFQERPGGDCFEPVRERIRSGKGRVRRSGPDYLAYALIDAVIDGYFPELEKINQQLAELEQRIFSTPDKRCVAALQEIRGELRELRAANWPHQDVVAALLRPDTPRVTDGTRLYLRDCADHAARVSELVESYREESSDLMNSYLSSVNNRMSEVMKVLTIVASIFIPLSFVAGVYGMNFEHMPELGWRWGYPAILGVMAAVGGSLLLLFKRKGWFR